MNLTKKCAKLTILALCVVAGLSACATSRGRVVTHDDVRDGAEIAVARESIPGVVEYIWEEPMVDTVDVPPGLDPEGHYYRPAHQEVVEIKQGRWKYHRANP